MPPNLPPLPHGSAGAAGAAGGPQYVGPGPGGGGGGEATEAGRTLSAGGLSGTAYNAAIGAGASLGTEAERVRLHNMLLTTRFKHVQTPDGHMVVTGVDGELMRCEDEVSGRRAGAFSLC